MQSIGIEGMGSLLITMADVAELAFVLLIPMHVVSKVMSVYISLCDVAPVKVQGYFFPS